MMRKNFSFLLASLVAVVLLVGCKEKPITTPGDLENPQIVMTTPLEMRVGQFIPISSSDTFAVDLAFTDDKDLRDWQITVRFMPELNYLRTTSADWSDTWFGDLDGISGAVNFDVVVIPDPTAGPYEFKVKVTDKEGKTAEKTTYFFVKNRADLFGPNVRFTAPDTANVDTFRIGNPMHVRALVNEVPGQVINNIHLRVRDKLTKQIVPGSEINWESLNQNSVVVDTLIDIPAGSVPGNYNVEVYAEDMIYNVTYKNCEVYIRPN